MKSIADIAKDVFEIESKAIYELKHRVGASFVSSIEAILNTPGRLVITGVGKSGIVGMKMAGTFSSTGTPSIFLHPTDAYHRDLGTIQSSDIILAISNSGESNELLQLLQFFKENNNIIIGLTANGDSTLAKNADYWIDISVHKEACPLDLAPTSSTTATMAMGDAMAVSLMEMRAFKKEDFAKFHPGGALGRKLLTKVEHVMKIQIPTISTSTTGREAIQQISAGKIGCVIVTDSDNNVSGLITDGDLRRAIQKYDSAIFDINVTAFMTQNPLTVPISMKLADAEHLMNEKKINLLIVSDGLKPLGIVQIYDI